MKAFTRRQFLSTTAAAAALPAIATAAKPKFLLNYILSSSMYGKLPLKEILPEVAKTAADTIDSWPAVHGNQREQIEAMGHDAFATMLRRQKTAKGTLRMGLSLIHISEPTRPY